MLTGTVLKSAPGLSPMLLLLKLVGQLPKAAGSQA